MNERRDMGSFQRPKWSSHFEKRINVILNCTNINEKFNLIDTIRKDLEFEAFQYSKTQDILRCMVCMLSLWEHVLWQIRKTSIPRCCSIGFSTILAIINRTEFSLHNCLTYQLTDKTSWKLTRHWTQVGVSKHDENGFTSEVMALKGRYKSLLERTLAGVVSWDEDRRRLHPDDEKDYLIRIAPQRNSYRSTTERMEEIKFMAEILAMSFFRLPGKTQTAVIDVIRGMIADGAFRCDEDSSSTRSKKVEKSLNEILEKITPRYGWENLERSFTAANPSLFIWSWIESDAELVRESVLRNWCSCMMHDLMFFNEFLRAFCEHIIRVTKSGNRPSDVVWQAVPATRLLLQIFIPILHHSHIWMTRRLDDLLDSTVEGEARRLRDQKFRLKLPLNPIAARAIINTSCVLLADRRILEIWVCLAFRTTNLNSPRSAAHCYERLRPWFNWCISLDTNQIEDPTFFTRGCLHFPPDSTVFYDGIIKLLTSNHFDILKSSLNFLYTYLSYFETPLREDISKMVLSYDMFFTLFLHWSEEVRATYHMLLVFKLFLTSRKDLPIHSDRQLGVEHEHIESRIHTSKNPQYRKMLRQQGIDNGSPDRVLDVAICENLDKCIFEIVLGTRSNGNTIIPKDKRVYSASALRSYKGFLADYYRLADANGIVEAPDPLIICQQRFGLF